MADESVPVSSIARRALDRMRDSTLTVERMVKGGTALPKRRGAPITSGRWMKIGEGEEGKYSWVAQKMNDEGRFEDDEDWGSGDHTEEGGWAVENRYRSEYVLEGSIVWGTPVPGRDCYVFEYNPGVQWVKSFDAINFPARTSTTPGEGTLTFMELDESGHFQEGQELKVFNGYKQPISLNSSKLAQAQFGLEGKWWITGVDC